MLLRNAGYPTSGEINQPKLMLVNQSCGGHTAIALRLPVGFESLMRTWFGNLFVLDDHNAIDTNVVQWQRALFVQRDSQITSSDHTGSCVTYVKLGAGH